MSDEQNNRGMLLITALVVAAIFVGAVAIDSGWWMTSQARENACHEKLGEDSTPIGTAIVGGDNAVICLSDGDVELVNQESGHYPGFGSYLAHRFGGI